MKRMKKAIAILCAIALVFTMQGGYRAVFADETPVGGTIPFDGSGHYTDELADFSHVHSYGNVSAVSGSAITYAGDNNGIKKAPDVDEGFLVYDAGEGKSFHKVSVYTSKLLQSWDYAPAYISDYIEVYQGVDNAGSIGAGQKLDLDREITGDGAKITFSDGYRAEKFIAWEIPAGIRYLVIKINKVMNSDNNAELPLEVTKIEFEEKTEASVTLTESLTDDFDYPYTIDPGDSNAGLVEDFITAVHAVKGVERYTDQYAYWQLMNDSSLLYAKSGETASITYELDFDAKYIYLGYFYYIQNDNYSEIDSIHLYVSPDGTEGSYTELNLTPETALTGWVHLPSIYTASSLPTGTRFLKLEFANANKSPKLSKLIVRGTDPDIERSGYADAMFTEIPIRIDGVIAADGEGSPTGEWAGAELIHIAGVVDDSGEKSARVYLKYDYDNLYFAARIKDPTPMVNDNTGGNLWNGDNIELFLGTEDINYIEQPGKKNTMIASDIQIVLSGGIVNGTTHAYLNINGQYSFPPFLFEVAADEDGLGYTMEASIPLNLMGITEPWNNREIIFNAVLNEGGSAGRGQWGWVTNDEAAKKSRGLWGLVSFEPADAPATEITAEAAYNAVSSVVTITGRAAEVRSKDITVLVRDSAGNIIYADQKQSDAAGNATFTYKSGAAGSYTVNVGGEGIERSNSTSFSIN